MKKMKLTALFLLIAMLLGLTACGGGKPASSPSSAPSDAPAASTPAEPDAPVPDGEVYNLRMSCEANEGQWLAIMLQDYADDVAEATNGRVQIELNLGSSLGAAGDVWSMFTQGAIEMINVGVAHAGHFPVTNVVQTPFVVSSPECAEAVMNTLMENGMLAEFTDNMHVVAFLPTLMQQFMFVDREVKTVEDLSGMVIRGSSAPLVACIEALGSTAISIPIPDLYMSLSQGVADGTITSVDAADVFKLQDVCKYVLDMPISTGMNFIGINKDVWNAFPADIQEAMDKVGAEYQQKYLELNRQAGEECLASMVAGGATVLTPSDELVNACKEATAGQLDQLIADLNAEGLDGAAIVAKAQEAIAAFEG